MSRETLITKLMKRYDLNREAVILHLDNWKAAGPKKSKTAKAQTETRRIQISQDMDSVYTFKNGEIIEHALVPRKSLNAAEGEAVVDGKKGVWRNINGTSVFIPNDAGKDFVKKHFEKKKSGNYMPMPKKDPPTKKRERREKMNQKFKDEHKSLIQSSNWKNTEKINVVVENEKGYVYYAKAVRVIQKLWNEQKSIPKNVKGLFIGNELDTPGAAGSYNRITGQISISKQYSFLLKDEKEIENRFRYVLEHELAHARFHELTEQQQVGWYQRIRGLAITEYALKFRTGMGSREYEGKSLQELRKLYNENYEILAGFSRQIRDAKDKDKVPLYLEQRKVYEYKGKQLRQEIKRQESGMTLDDKLYANETWAEYHAIKSGGLPLSKVNKKDFEKIDKIYKEMFGDSLTARAQAMMLMAAVSLPKTISTYDKNGRTYAKIWLIDDSRNVNGWRVSWESIKKYARTFIGRPGIEYTKCTKMGCRLDHTDEQYSKEANLKFQEKFRRTTIIDVLLDESTHAAYAIHAVHSREFAEKIKRGEIIYGSPSVWPDRERTITTTNPDNLEENIDTTAWDGMHYAFVDDPAYGQKSRVIATCEGPNCANELRDKSLVARAQVLSLLAAARVPEDQIERWVTTDTNIRFPIIKGLTEAESSRRFFGGKRQVSTNLGYDALPKTAKHIKRKTYDDIVKTYDEDIGDEYGQGDELQDYYEEWSSDFYRHSRPERKEIVDRVNVIYTERLKRAKNLYRGTTLSELDDMLENPTVGGDNGKIYTYLTTSGTASHVFAFMRSEMDINDFYDDATTEAVDQYTERNTPVELIIPKDKILDELVSPGYTGDTDARVNETDIYEPQGTRYFFEEEHRLPLRTVPIKDLGMKIRIFVKNPEMQKKYAEKYSKLGEVVFA